MHRLVDADLFLQIAVGRAILAHPSSIGVSTFILGYPDYPYVEDKWLSSTIVAIVDALGGHHALMTYQIALCVLVALAWYFMQRAWQAAPSLALVGVALALLACNFRMEPRPDTISHGLLALVIGLMAVDLPLARARWLLPLLLAVWVNLHGYFVNGLLVLTAAAVATLLRDADLLHRGPYPIDARGRWLIMGSALAACCLHPQGWRALASPVEQLIQLRTDPLFRTSIQEFSPSTALLADAGIIRWCLLGAAACGGIAFGISRISRAPYVRQGFALVMALPWVIFPPPALGSLGYRVSVALFIMAAVEIPSACRRREYFRPMLLVGFAILALSMVRNVPLLVPTSLVLLTPTWTAAVAQAAARRPQVSRMVTVATVLVVAVVGWLRVTDRLGTDVRAPSRTGWGIDRDKFPVGAAGHLAADAMPDPFLNNFDSGGYLLYRLHPARRVFIAGNTSMYPLEFLGYYRAAVTGATPNLGEVVSRYGTTSAILDFNSPAGLRLAHALALDPAWRLELFDRGGAVFRRTSDAKPPPSDIATRVHELASGDRVAPAVPVWLGGKPLVYPALNFAHFLAAIGRPDLAAEESFRLWALVPAEDAAVLGGGAARDAGNLAAYVPELEDAVRRYPHSGSLRSSLLLGLALRSDDATRRGALADAERDLHRMVGLQPDACGPYFALARNAALKRDVGTAAALMEQGRKNDRDGSCARSVAADPILSSLMKHD